MIELGKINTLKVLRSTPPGMFLGKEGEEEVVLLPNKYIPKGLEVNDHVDVFIYKDSEDRLIATTLNPKIKLHEFACLEVIDINSNGAFLDWGLEKDLMVPFGEQKKDMRQGEWYLVYLYLDKESNRLLATSKIDRFVKKSPPDFSIGYRVDLLIGDESPLGVNVIINNEYQGLIYHNEIFKKIRPNEKTIGYIKNIRPDGKIDVSLQQQGYANVDPSSDIILDKLKENNGFLALNDNSDPKDIMKELQMSKKTFKKAVGLLYKQRLITIEESGIRLMEG